jgi:tripartite-type tricarboxylate transporter receptor subunit TctC
MGSAVRMGPGHFPYLLGILFALLGMVICIKTLIIHGARIESASLHALIFVFGACAASATLSQDYPSRPIRIIVPFPAGGTADLLARQIGQTMSETLHEQVVIENRSGAGGNIGADLAAKSKPDGYTLLMGTVSTHAINPNLYTKMPYDPVKDFAPVTMVASMPNLLVVHPSVPAKNVAELIALAKAKPGALAFASAGNGTSQHLAGELFKKMAGVDMIHVPYKGNAPAVTDLVGGQVQVMFDNIPVSLQQVRAGKLRALAVTGPARSAVLPDLPTVAEAGLPGYSITSWFGLYAPSGTSPQIIERLNQEANRALATAQIRRRLTDQGIEPAGGTPDQFADFMHAELVKWGKIVRESGARVE